MANIHHLVDTQPDICSTLKQIGKIAHSNNKEVYVVGGVVRDLFLDRPLNEIDLMVIGDGIQFAEILAKEMGVKKVVPFPKFSTAHIPSNPVPIEVAAARKESYDNNSRKPKEVVYTDLKGDLIRRDFTVNAMAMSLTPKKFGELHDPYNGVKDLQAKRLVTPLDPDETFSEDPIRMLRAAYFASGLGLEIDKKCLESMQRQANRINIVSQERITTEFEKILSTPKPSVGLIILQEAGLMEYIFPEIHIMFGMDQTGEWHHKDIFYHTMQVVDNAAELSDKMQLRFAALVHDIAKPNTRKIDPKKGYTFHGHDAIGERMLNKVAKRRVMVMAGDDIDDLLTLCRADITTKNPQRVKKYMSNFEQVELKMKDVAERDSLKSFQSPVRGAEIMKICGLTEGPVVGEIKVAIEEAILDGKIDNNYESAYEYFMKIKDEHLKSVTDK